MFKKIGIKINTIGKNLGDLTKEGIEDKDIKNLLLSHVEKIELLQEEIEALNKAFETFYKKTRVLIILNSILFLIVVSLVSFIFINK